MEVLLLFYLTNQKTIRISNAATILKFKFSRNLRQVVPLLVVHSKNLPHTTPPSTPQHQTAASEYISPQAATTRPKYKNKTYSRCWKDQQSTKKKILPDRRLGIQCPTSSGGIKVRKPKPLLQDVEKNSKVQNNMLVITECRG